MTNLKPIIQKAQEEQGELLDKAMFTYTAEQYKAISKFLEQQIISATKQAFEAVKVEELPYKKLKECPFHSKSFQYQCGCVDAFNEAVSQQQQKIEEFLG